MSIIIRVERIVKVYGLPLEESINEYMETLDGEGVADIRFYSNEGEIRPSTAYLFITKVKE